MTGKHGRVTSGCLGCTLVAALSLALSLCAFAQQEQSQPAQATQQAQPMQPGQTTPQPPDQQLAGTISGTIVDQTGAALVGARVKLIRGDQSPGQEVLSNGDGQFSFTNIAPGPFQLAITAAGFAAQTFSGTLQPGEINIVPQIALGVATENVEVKVVVPPAELAEVEVKEEEQQRVLGVIPNFYVSYYPDAVPLSPKQKFNLAWRTTIDPVTFLVNGGIAGLQQAQNNFSGYGQGAQGYGKRYGASYADLVTGTYIGGAMLPSLLKQDPRYFYKGSGSIRSRILYAIANSVICKGDDKHWQANYSGILGSLASGGISNLYYPANDRGAELTFENTAIGIGAAAAANLLQEFFIPKLTPNFPSHRQAKP